MGLERSKKWRKIGIRNWNWRTFATHAVRGQNWRRNDSQRLQTQRERQNMHALHSWMSKTTTTTCTRTLSQVCHFLQQETPNPAVMSGVVVTTKDNVCEKQNGFKEDLMQQNFPANLKPAARTSLNSPSLCRDPFFFPGLPRRSPENEDVALISPNSSPDFHTSRSI
jgi:hypothetical protein